jgi:Zinc finger, C3HC4 type (RING finger)
VLAEERKGNGFEASSDFANETLLKLRRNPVRPEVTYTLNLEDVKSPLPVNDDFVCICFNVVNDPVQCSKCSRLFCKKCVNDWLAGRSYGNRKCPGGCNAEFVGKDIDRLVKNTLGAFVFVCTLKGKGCGENFTYNDAFKHA